MSTYLPEKKTFAVCSFQSGPSPIPLVARREGKVSFKSKDALLLTEYDRKLEGQFVCKTKWTSGAGTMAFGAGVMAGLAIAAAVATVPVAGWIVGGIIAIGCIAYGLYQMLSKPTCSQMIGFQESQWVNPYTTVTFDGFQAVTKNSFIICKEGGILLPFVSSAAAIAAGQNVSSYNRKEIGVSLLANFLGGTAFGFTLGANGVLIAGKEVAFGVAGSYLVFQPLEKGQRALTREIYDADENNLYYDAIVKEESKMLNLTETKIDKPGDLYNPGSVLSDLKATRSLALESGATQAQIAEIDGAIKQAESSGSLAAGKNSKASSVFQKARSGIYGPKVKSYFTNRVGTGSGMNRQSNYDQAMADRQSNLSSTNKKITTQKVFSKINIATLILPFISTGLSESALKNITDAGSSDVTAGNTINASGH